MSIVDKMAAECTTHLQRRRNTAAAVRCLATNDKLVLECALVNVASSWWLLRLHGQHGALNIVNRKPTKQRERENNTTDHLGWVQVRRWFVSVKWCGV